MNIRYERLNVVNEGIKDGLLGYYEVEIYGLKSKLNGKHFAQAHFGHFRETNERSILYSATVYTDKNGDVCHNYQSEFLDDLNFLKSGNCETFD